uniref:Uncharacterized protein n=1 Tax=Aegilops tauschii subsp. strangulata TaxID=200361 RepID=A0A453EXH2_AEGTS
LDWLLLTPRNPHFPPIARLSLPCAAAAHLANTSKEAGRRKVEGHRQCI